MTIKEAAKKALENIGSPANLDQILEEILHNNFYVFGCKPENQRNVLRTEMTRACKGVAWAYDYSDKIFYKEGPLTFV